MENDRLQCWPILPKPELQRRVDAEISRWDLSFAEAQLLEAARERLMTWREPIRSRYKEIIMDDTTTEPAPPITEETKKEIKVKSKSKPKKAAASKAKKKAAAKPAKATAKAKGNGRIDPDAKVVVIKKENPYREGTGAYKRVETVLKSSGQTAGTIAKKSGMRSSTLATCRKAGLIRIEA